MKTLKQELQETLNLIHSKNLDCIDVLPILRKHSKDSVVETIFQAIDSNPWNYNLCFQNPNIQTLLLNKSNHNPTQLFTCETEPDIIHVQYRVPSTLFTEITDEILMQIVSLMLYDCTDCCNALSFVNFSAMGYYATGDVSMTYHS